MCAVIVVPAALALYVPLVGQLLKQGPNRVTPLIASPELLANLGHG